MPLFRAFLLVLVFGLGVARAEAAPALETYGRLPAIEFVGLSPSGDRFASVAVDGETRKLLVRTVGGEALAAADIGEARVRELAWADEDHVVVMVTRTAAQGPKRETTAAYILNARTGGTVRAFGSRGDETDVVSGFYGSYREGGRAWALFRTHSAVTLSGALYRVDLGSGAAHKLADAGARGFDWILGPGGEVVARTAYDAAAKTLNLIPGANGDTVVASRPYLLGDVTFSGLGRTAQTTIMADRSGDEDLFEEVSLIDGKRTALPDADDYESIIRDRASHLAIGARLKGDRGELFFDPARQARYDAARRAFPKLQVRLASANDAFDRLVVFTDGGDDSGTYWLLDARTGKASEIGGAYPAITHADVGPTRWFSYKAADGLEIKAVLTLPPGRAEKGLPLIVMPHGGPLGVEDRLSFDWWAQAFTSRGYAVLQPNYRGSGGRGPAFRKAGLGQWGRKMQTDLSDGVAALAASGVVDPRRVCIVGGSYGGYAALAGVTLQSGVYRCAVSYGGLSDTGMALARYGGSRSFALDGRGYMRAALGASWAGDPILRAISPVYSAAKASAPILLIHGKDDTVVPIAQSEEMEAALTHAGKPVQFVQLDGEDHWLSKQKTRTEMLNASVAFVETWNPPN
jgi:dipeptidyl aminopeptidase/acylaminoacyl peptidase